MNFKSVVFKMAHQLMKNFHWTLSEALKQSWKVWKLRKQLHQGICQFNYLKKDGTLREAFGTLRNVEYLYKGSNKFQFDNLTVRYFDVEAQDFRAFKAQNLQSICI